MAVFLFALIQGLSQPAFGYALLGPQWAPGDVPLGLHLNKSETLSDGSTFAAVFASAVDEWNRNMADIKVVASPKTGDKGAAGDSINQAFFADSAYGYEWDDSILAVTFIWSDNGRVVESDILFNNKLKWDSYRGSLRYKTATQPIPEFRRVALAELGLFLGLDFDILLKPGEAIMAPAMSDLEHLSLNDKAGLARLYWFGPDNVPVAPVLLGPIYVSLGLTEGDSFSLVPSIDSLAPCYVKWFKDDVLIYEGREAVYSRSGALASRDDGEYHFIASNPGGSVTSEKKKMAMKQIIPPSVTLVSDTEVEFGDYYSLQPSIQGGRLTYKWYKDGVLLNEFGGSDGALELAPVQYSHAGVYELEVSNVRGVARSNPFKITVVPPKAPKIEAPNATQFEAKAGSYFSISTHVTGQGAISYQWFKDGRPVTQGTWNLDLPAISPSDAGDYVLIVSSQYGWTSSPTFHVRVSDPDYIPFRARMLNSSFLNAGSDWRPPADYDGLVGKTLHNGNWLTDSSHPAPSPVKADFSNSGEYQTLVDRGKGFRLEESVHVTVVEGRESANSSLEIRYPWTRTLTFGNWVCFYYPDLGVLKRYDLGSRSWLPELTLAFKGLVRKTTTYNPVCVDSTGVYYTDYQNLYFTGFATGVSKQLRELSGARSLHRVHDLLFINADSFRGFLNLADDSYHATNEGFSENAQIDPGSGAFFDPDFDGRMIAMGSVDTQGNQTTYELNPKLPGYDPSALQSIASALSPLIPALFTDSFAIPFGDWSSRASVPEKVISRCVSLGAPLFLLADGSLLLLRQDFSVAGYSSVQNGAALITAPDDQSVVIFGYKEGDSQPTVTELTRDSIGPVAVRENPNSPEDFFPSSVAYASDGRIFLSDLASGRVRCWDPKIRAFSKTTACAPNALDFAYSEEDDSFVFSHANGMISRVAFGSSVVSSLGFVNDVTSRFRYAGPKMAVLGAQVLKFSQDGLRTKTLDFVPTDFIPQSKRAVGVNYGTFRSVDFDVEGNLVGVPRAISGVSGESSANTPGWSSPDGATYISTEGYVSRPFDAGSQKVFRLRPFSDVQWFGGKLYSLHQQRGGVQVERRDPSSLEVEAIENVMGEGLRLCPQPDGSLVVVALASGVPFFVCLDADLKRLWSSGEPALSRSAILEQPAGGKWTLGTTVVLAPKVSALPDTRFQWLFNGKQIVGANGKDLNLGALSPESEGLYTLLVMDEAGVQKTMTIEVEGIQDSSRLYNLSTRSFVGSSGKEEIAGFFVSGAEPKTILVRAAGPALKDFGLDDFCSDPVIHLFGPSGEIAMCDDWSADADTSAALLEDFRRAGAFPFANGSKDAALVVTLSPGPYTAVISSKDAGGVGLAEVYELNSTKPASRLGNISTRAHIKTGEQLEIAGIYILGQAHKRVLIRAIGPGLSPFGLADLLSNPLLTLTDSKGRVIQVNDDWTNGEQDPIALRNASRLAGAFDLAFGSKDSVLLVDLEPGAYTAQVTGVDGDSGIALVEIYETQ